MAQSFINAAYTEIEPGSFDAYAKKSELLDLIYPVGSIYISVNSTSPAALFGGTWTQIEGQFLLASSDTYTAGSTGGEATHALTTNELPSHRHLANVYTVVCSHNAIYRDYGAASFKAGGTLVSIHDEYETTGDYEQSQGYGGKVGGNAAHNNMPPYLSVYMWKRTA